MPAGPSVNPPGGGTARDGWLRGRGLFVLALVGLGRIAVAIDGVALVRGEVGGGHPALHAVDVDAFPGVAVGLPLRAEGGHERAIVDSTDHGGLHGGAGSQVEAVAVRADDDLIARLERLLRAGRTHRAEGGDEHRRDHDEG